MIQLTNNVIQYILWQKQPRRTSTKSSIHKNHVKENKFNKPRTKFSTSLLRGTLTGSTRLGTYLYLLVIFSSIQLGQIFQSEQNSPMITFLTYLTLDWHMSTTRGSLIKLALNRTS